MRPQKGKGGFGGGRGKKPQGGKQRGNRGGPPDLKGNFNPRDLYEVEEKEEHEYKFADRYLVRSLNSFYKVHFRVHMARFSR